MVINWLLKKGKTNIVENHDFDLLNKGYLVCENCSSQHLLNFYKPLSFSKCSKCGQPMFIPHRVSEYWLLEPLGSGGMGSVYKAVHFQSGDKYSVKLLQRDSRTESEAIESLLYEGKVGKEISDHPNLCYVTEFGSNNNEIYIVSRFLEGTRLDILVDNYGPVSEEKVLLWALHLLSGLNHIYKKGYIYRDMKPQNIIISKNQDKATLFDYGLCVKVDEQKNDGDHIIGSPIFLPPERCTLTKEDMHSEIYSLGMVLFYCLSGNTFYISDSIEEIIDMHVRKIRKNTVASFLPETNPDITAIIERMIKRKPKDRYQSYNEAFKEIKQIYDIYKCC